MMERLKFIEKIMADIRVQLKKQHIEAEVTGSETEPPKREMFHRLWYRDRSGKR